MARRFSAPYQSEPVSSLATWARNLAVFSVVAVAVSILIVRFGFLEVKPAIATFFGALGRDLQFDRLDVRIGRALLLGGIKPGIDGRVGAVAAAQARQRIEARRIDRIGGDVVDRRQLAVLQAEIGRIG
ncbi:MAG: hypothetical protein JOZ58_18960, partial [Acetobacteraceae bacterium]|nr:hypothetical protein [Acetobacteraceae bacterium]